MKTNKNHRKKMFRMRERERETERMLRLRNMIKQVSAWEYKRAIQFIIVGSNLFIFNSILTT